MPLYNLKGPVPETPIYLVITTDDNGLINELTLPFYRAADATIKTLVRDWAAYIEASGSPPLAQDLEQFKNYLANTYGSDVYAVYDRS